MIRLRTGTSLEPFHLTSIPEDEMQTLFLQCPDKPSLFIIGPGSRIVIQKYDGIVIVQRNRTGFISSREQFEPADDEEGAVIRDHTRSLEDLVVSQLGGYGCLKQT